MAFVGSSCDEIPANSAKESRSYMLGVGLDTARYGRVWPNEWPNGEIRAGDRCLHRQGEASSRAPARRPTRASVARAQAAYSVPHECGSVLHYWTRRCD